MKLTRHSYIMKEYGTVKDFNMEVVVIGHNEGKYVKAMVESLPKEWKIKYVADRCTDNTINTLFELLEDKREDGRLIGISTNPFLEGRQTSYARNTGAAACDDSEGILFLDGDRYPIQGDIKKAVDDCDSDILLFRVEDDFRTNDNFALNYGRVYNGFFSCGVYFTKEALDKIRAFQNGQIFSEGMQKYWGIEDTYLGDVCYHLGLSAKLDMDVVLNGTFDRNTVDSVDVIELRLRERLKLNVKWD